MEKRKPTYELTDIQLQFSSPDKLNMTRGAMNGMRAMGMEESGVCEVIQGLTRGNFYKSMTTEADHKVWQDVYHARWGDFQLYIKFQWDDERKYFVVQFKEK